MIIKIHEINDLKEKLGSWRDFAASVGIAEQNVRRYKSGYIVIERDGKFKLDKREFWL